MISGGMKGVWLILGKLNFSFRYCAIDPSIKQELEDERVGFRKRMIQSNDRRRGINVLIEAQRKRKKNKNEMKLRDRKT